MIDIVARDMDDLLSQLDGRQVATTAGRTTLCTAQPEIVHEPMPFGDRLLHVITDPNARGGGVLGIGAIVSFVLGSLLLYQPFGIPSPMAPAVRVSPWLVAAMTAGMTAFFGLVVRALVRAQRAEVLTGTQALVGRNGVAVTNLHPGGQTVGSLNVRNRREGCRWSRPI